MSEKPGKTDPLPSCSDSDSDPDTPQSISLIRDHRYGIASSVVNGEDGHIERALGGHRSSRTPVSGDAREGSDPLDVA